MRTIIIFILAAFAALAADWKVIKIADGDTITVSRGKQSMRVRFWGIDAPESDQRYGKACTKELAKKLRGASVQLEIKATDKYKRKVARVFKNGEDINRYMVEIGCAWAYTYYTKAYLPQQRAAQKGRLGLWQDSKPIEPYLWRKSHKKPWQKNSSHLKNALTGGHHG